jgi:crotonobetaine/carnitine-CoA ligase
MKLPPLEERTVPAVFASALRTRPDAVAVRDPERSLTYAALHDAALRVAGGFSSAGVAAGEPLLLLLDDHLDFVLAWLATALTGRVEVPVNTAYKGRMLAHVVGDAGARVIVTEERYCARLAAILDEIPSLETVIVRGGPGEALAGTRVRVVAWEEVRDGSAPGAPVAIRPWDQLAIMYTSGTTGQSKGVHVTHAHAYGYCSPEVYGAASEGDVALVSLPLFHIAGQWAGVYNALIAGASAVVLPRFSASGFWDDVRSYGATYALLLGAMATFLQRQPERPGDAGTTLSRVLMVPVIAGVEAFAERFGVVVGTAYGSTEGSTPIAARFGEARPKRCGRPREDFDVRLVDEHDVEVPRGEVGELVLRPHDPWSVMAGYHGLPEATARAWRNLWLHTGDAMREDTDGNLEFMDRTNDAIRRRGENVSSFEVEAEVNAHPSVLESAVIGVRSDDTEQEIMAVVALQDGAALDPAELIGRLAERLPYFMVPRYVEVVGELPKTPTQKVRKEVLRSTGVTAATWDREAAGIKVRRD